MSVMVIGGSGHVGAYVVKELIEEGKTPVSFDVQAPPKELIDKMDFVKGDVLDFSGLLRCIKEKKVDRIIHMASLLTTASQKDPVKAYQLNIGGMLNVLESARLMEVKRVVYTSSIAVYGRIPQGESPVLEDHAKEPISIYGATKLFNEYLQISYYRD